MRRDARAARAIFISQSYPLRCRSSSTTPNKLLPHPASAMNNLIRLGSALVRPAVLATVVSLSIISLAVADEVRAAARKPTDIPAQHLGTALNSLAADFELQVLYRSEVVGTLQTEGVSGSTTAAEALERVLSGTGLTFRYLDEKTVMIVPLSRDEGGSAPQGPLPNAGTEAARNANSPRSDRGEASSGRFRLAQSNAGVGAKASTVDADVSKSAGVEEVLVTGSRISGQTNLTSPSVIAVATHEDIVLSKAASVEEVLARIPGVDFNGGVSSANNNSSGQSVVALRNLGPQRTLVLLDGQRLIPQFGGSTNLNLIPLSMVDHIEVLKDGASSIYGADAIGGVINLITKKHEEGVALSADYGVSSEGDAQTKSVTATLGANVDKGNILVGLAWNRRDPLLQINREWATATHADDPHFPGGSAYRSTLDILGDQNNTNQVWAGAANSNGASSSHDPALVGAAPNLAFISGRNRIQLNSGAWNYLATGLDQKQINLAGRLNVKENLSVVVDGFFTRYIDDFRLGPDALPGDLITTPRFKGFIIPTTNPYNLTGSSITANLIPLQMGPRDYSVDSEVYRMRFGFEGQIANRFNWELGYVRQENSAIFNVAHQFNYDHVSQLLGQVPCVNVPGGCTNGLPTTPVNFFNAPNIFSAEQIAYLTFDNTSLSHDSENYGYGNINGTLMDLPAGPVKAAIGFESRQEHYDNTPNELAQDGLAGGGISLPTDGGYNVRALYAELRIPVLNDAPFAKALNLSPSVRYDDYSTFGGQTTFKVGLDYQPTSDVRFRGAYATAIRAPRVGELYAGLSGSNPSAGGDPCETNPAYSGNTNFGNGVLTAGSTCSRAVAGGAAVTSFTSVIDANPNSQIQQSQGGNPNLQPEKAHTITAGIVLTPAVTPGLTVTADYYNVKISDTILTSGVAGSTGVDFVLNRCYGPAQDERNCAYVLRDSRGNIVQIDSLATNIGGSLVRGIDYELAYNTRAADLAIPLIGGAFNFDLFATQQLKSQQTNPDGSLADFNGFFNVNNQTFQPKWKGIFTADYLRGPWKVRYDARASSSAENINGSDPYSGNYIPSIVYHDLSVSYDVPGFLGIAPTRFILGVNNLADKEPPFIGSEAACRCNALAGPFDVVGRYFYSSVSMHF